MPAPEGIGMRIKCLKLECQCGKTELGQLFLNKEGTIRYARVRHFSHNDTLTHKPQFTYCRIGDLDAVKTLLKSQDMSLDTEKAVSGHIGQVESREVPDLETPKDSLNQQNMCGRRLVWFRTLAFQANDPGFKSRRPHH
jgi:hypothetical protein